MPKARWALSQEQDKNREAPTACGGSGATETAAKMEPTDRGGPVVIQRVFLLSEECFPSLAHGFGISRLLTMTFSFVWGWRCLSQEKIS